MTVASRVDSRAIAREAVSIAKAPLRAVGPSLIAAVIVGLAICLMIGFTMRKKA